MIVLKRLEQVLLEEQYSSKHIIANVTTEIRKLGEIDLISNLRESIRTLYSTQYSYQSKNDRMDKLREMQMDDIVTAVLLSLLPFREPVMIQRVVDLLAMRLNSDDVLQNVKNAADILVEAAKADLCDMNKSKFNRLQLVNNIELSDQFYEYLDRVQYLPPLVHPPKQVRNNYESGYYTFKDSLILGGKHKEHGGQLNYDVINTQGRIEWEIDLDIYALKELPNKVLDSQEKVQQFTLMKNSSKEVYDLMLDHGNSFYFNHKYDFRGRFYTDGYHINNQSTDYKKALINFKKKELVI